MKRVVTSLMVVVLMSWVGWSNRSARAQGAAVTVMAAGDIACSPSDPNFNHGQGTARFCHEMATSNLIVAAHPDAVFALGDLQYGGGTLAAFQQSYGPSWGRVRAITYPLLGNEDYANPDAMGYFGYFGKLARNDPGGYYSFDLGAWHIISLNSLCNEPGVGGCGIGSSQETWLLDDLASHRSACTLAMWHFPRFTSGKNGNHPEMQTFWDDLYAFGTDILLHGHDHIYERFAPQNPGQQADPRGIREFIVGTGGNNHQPHFGTLQPNNEVLDNTTFGVLKLSLADGSYAWEFLPDQQAGNGKLTDQGTGTCHPVGAGSTGPRAVPLLSADGDGGMVARFTVDYMSKDPGQGEVLFGPGPGCTGLIMTATADRGAGSTHHRFIVTGDDLAGPGDDTGLLPGATYWYETATMTGSGSEIDNNGGKCYAVTIPKS
ncbi:MAG TPA: metallophosphoesterase [Chloroflexota bacterium]|nr:metallophosphoesterase [Chloroflexota bacterium]